MPGCLMFRKNHEAHIPTFCYSAQAHPRISGAYAHARRQGGHTLAAGKGSVTPRGLKGNERFRNEQRLRGEAIEQILAGYRPRRSGAILIQVRANGLGHPRLGLIVPKRILPRAVDRNRAKRLVREWFRRNQPRLEGNDLLVRLRARPACLSTLVADLGCALVHEK